MADEKTVIDEDKDLLDDEGDDPAPKKEVDPAKDDKSDEDPDKGADPDKPDEEDSDIEEEKIPVRSSMQHIIARKNKQIEKLKSRVQKDDEPDEDGGEDPDLTPEARKALDRRIKKGIQEGVDPLVDVLVRKVDEDELNTLFTTEPEAKKYEKRIRSYMKSEAWKSIPPSAIYHHLAFEAAAQVGAKKKAVADKEAKILGGAGSSRRPKEKAGSAYSAEEIEKMSDKEIEELQNKVLQGK